MALGAASESIGSKFDFLTEFPTRCNEGVEDQAAPGVDAAELYRISPISETHTQIRLRPTVQPIEHPHRSECHLGQPGRKSRYASTFDPLKAFRHSAIYKPRKEIGIALAALSCSPFKRGSSSSHFSRKRLHTMNNRAEIEMAGHHDHNPLFPNGTPTNPSRRSVIGSLRLRSQSLRLGIRE